MFQSRLIQAGLPLDPVLGNNPRDPRVMLHNVAAPRSPGPGPRAPDLQAIINLNKSALHDIVRTKKKYLKDGASCNSTLFQSLNHIFGVLFCVDLKKSAMTTEYNKYLLEQLFISISVIE